MQGKSLVMLLVVLYASAFLAGFNENLVNMALMSIMKSPIAGIIIIVGAFVLLSVLEVRYQKKLAAGK